MTWYSAKIPINSKAIHCYTLGSIVYVPSDEAREWLDARIKPFDWVHYGKAGDNANYYFGFKSKEQAVMFKLVWGG